MSLQPTSTSSSNSLSSGSSSNGTSDDSARSITAAGSAGAGAGARHDAAALDGKGQDMSGGKVSKVEGDEQVATARKLKQGKVANGEQRRVASDIKNGKQERVVVVIDDDENDDIPIFARKGRKLSSDGDTEKTKGLTDHDGPPKQRLDHQAVFGGLARARSSDLALSKPILSPTLQELQESTTSQPSSSPNIPEPHQPRPHHPLLPHILAQDVINLNPCTSETTETIETSSSPSGIGGRKDWTAGMYLDFCLTLQRSFDFDAFAVKYGIPVAKVLDRFQALVLHPVMNHNEKGRMRVVEGGRARVKEWYDAKKETRKRMREEREEAEEMMRGEE